MAVIGRRTLLAGAAALALAPAGAAGQGSPEAQRFIEQAYASAQFQKRISAIAAGRDIRPEIKELAATVLAFRDRQIPALADLAKSQGVAVRETLDLQLQTVLENLEPLDFLALARRYAEVEREAIAAEIRAYEGAANAAAPPIADYVRATLPAIRELAAKVQAQAEAIKP